MARRRRQSGSGFVGLEGIDSFSEDLKRLEKGLRQLPDRVAKRAISSAVTRGTAGFLEEAMGVTPKGKTGNLVSGLGKKSVARITEGKGGVFKLRIGFDRAKAPHAILVEDGTKSRYTKSGVFVGAYRGKVTARRFFVNLTRTRAPDIAAAIVAELKKGFQRVAKKYLPNT